MVDRISAICKECNGTGEVVASASRYGAPSRCKECGGTGRITEAALAGALQALEITVDKMFTVHKEHEKELARVRDMLTFEHKRADHWAQRCLRIEAAARAALNVALDESASAVDLMEALGDLQHALKPEETAK